MAADLDDPAEPWRTAQEGISTDVPPPVRPRRRLPRRIANQGEEMLAGFIELIVGPAGQETQVDEAAAKFGVVRLDRIEYSVPATVGPLQVSASNWGKMVSVCPARRKELRRLS